MSARLALASLACCLAISAPAAAAPPTSDGARPPAARPRPAAAPSGHQRGGPSTAPAPPLPPHRPGTSRARTAAADALAALLASLLLLAPRLRRLRRPSPPRLLAALAVLLALLAAWLVWAPDTVIYHNNHAWGFVRAVARPDLRARSFGPTPAALSAALGVLAPAGHEPFWASRVGALLAVVFLYAWTHELTGSPRAALLGAGLLAAQPALHYAARSEYLSTPGLALMLLAAWLVVLAGRQRAPLVLVPATLALGLLATFRAQGAIVWPLVAGLVFVPRPAPGPDQPGPGRRGAVHFSQHFWLAAAAGLALVAAVAWPHLRALEAARGPYEAHSGAWSLLANLPWSRSGILGDGVWTAPALPWLALGGAVVALATPRRGPSRLPLLALWCVAFAVVVGAVTLHMAGTFLNALRYHLWVFVPVTTLAGLGLVALLQGRLPGVRGAWRPLAFAVLMAWLAVGSWTPAEAAALDHPEARQLRLWRAAAASLPPGATLVTPSRRGDTALDYPEGELHAARPDVRRVAWPADPGLPGDRPTWVFFPLSCDAPSLLATHPHAGEETAPSTPPRDDCRRIRQRWCLRPELVAAMTLRAPSGTPDAGEEVAGDGDYWVFPGLAGRPPRAGLYRVVGPKTEACSGAPGPPG